MVLDKSYYKSEVERYEKDKEIYQYALITAVKEFDEKMIDTICSRIHNCNTQIEYCSKRISELNTEGK
jgi:hypothetical protein